MIKLLNLSFVSIGITLIAIAYWQANFITQAAQEDFSDFVRAAGGGLTHTPNFPDTYKQISANRRMLQNFYIGGSGMIILAASCSRFLRSFERGHGTSRG